jgi:hypothetical protein
LYDMLTDNATALTTFHSGIASCLSSTESMSSQR